MASRLVWLASWWHWIAKVIASVSNASNSLSFSYFSLLHKCCLSRGNHRAYERGLVHFGSQHLAFAWTWIFGSRSGDWLWVFAVLQHFPLSALVPILSLRRAFNKSANSLSIVGSVFSFRFRFWAIVLSKALFPPCCASAGSLSWLVDSPRSNISSPLSISTMLSSVLRGRVRLPVHLLHLV